MELDDEQNEHDGQKANDSQESRTERCQKNISFSSQGAKPKATTSFSKTSSGKRQPNLEIQDLKEEEKLPISQEKSRPSSEQLTSKVILVGPHENPFVIQVII